MKNQGKKPINKKQMMVIDNAIINLSREKRKEPYQKEKKRFDSIITKLREKGMETYWIEVSAGRADFGDMNTALFHSLNDELDKYVASAENFDLNSLLSFVLKYDYEYYAFGSGPIKTEHQKKMQAVRKMKAEAELKAKVKADPDVILQEDVLKRIEIKRSEGKSLKESIHEVLDVDLKKDYEGKTDKEKKAAFNKLKIAHYRWKEKQQSPFKRLIDSMFAD